MTRRVAQIDDAWTDPLYDRKDDARIAGIRSMIGVPLMREGEPIGVIALARCRVEPFNDREIEFVATFADQAVIAIENVRLFEAEQQRTRELTELLEQQTATSEVMRVISSSPGDLQPVFKAILATRSAFALQRMQPFGFTRMQRFASSHAIAARYPGNMLIGAQAWPEIRTWPFARYKTDRPHYRLCGPAGLS